MALMQRCKQLIYRDIMHIFSQIAKSVQAYTLIDDMPEKSIIELVRKIEAHELNLDRIIEYGYAFSYTTNTALRSNLKTLKNRTSIEPIIRY